MKIKKITQKIEQYAIEAYDRGYYEATQEIYNEAYEEGFTDGVAGEQERIQAVLNLHAQWALESGKGSEIVMINRIKDILVPIVITQDEDDTF
jgi:flagellar biosynthesis/type III secretory pathway protein FliH